MKATGKIVIINSTPGFCAKDYAEEDLRWGASGDYALALQAMKDNGLAINEEVHTSLDDITAQADIFYLRDWRYSYSSLSAFINRHTNAKTIVDLQINPFEIHSLQRRTEFIYLYKNRKEQIYLKIARGFRYSSDILKLATIAFIGSYLNKWLLMEINKYANNMKTRYHVTPWVRRNGQIEAINIRRNHVDYDRFSILFIGKCIFRKGLLRLFRALKISGLEKWGLVVVTDSIRDTEVFDYAGNKLERTELLNDLLTHPNVKFLPWSQSIAEMISLYRRSHLYVCPSLSDNGPNTVIESIVCGLPVVLSDMSGAIESVPEPYRVQFRVPKWWKNENVEGCEEGIAEVLLSYYQDIFLKKRGIEYGEALRKDYLKANYLMKLYSEYKEVFQV